MIFFYRLLIPIASAAQGAGQFNVSGFNYGGGDYSIQSIVRNIISVLNNTILPVCFAVFLLGALLFMIGPALGKSDLQSNGKGMMIGACIGVVIVLSAQGLLGIVSFFIWGGTS